MPFATSPDGVRVHYELDGEGPALMLQHGTGGSLEMWKGRGFVERLRDHYQLVLVDSRGHGESDRPRDRASYALPHRAALPLPPRQPLRCRWRGHPHVPPGLEGNTACHW
jgi:pimeloyl-ACP methyl ester carboxylesterase